MSRPLSDALHGQQLRDALFVLGATGGFLFVAGFLGYGNFATTLPGVVLLVLIGSLGFWLSRSVK
ncbi:hypothetical protein [Salinigranum marinum]|uniref:hypothetical protein n=1 Tax=Salinigranum marinum TaxID=1515595 RepID=UPI002989BE83|nr:hypothetical protein [Salinigranum marinum]